MPAVDCAADGVIQEISPNDTMLVPGWQSHYFMQGQSALQCIQVAMRAANLTDVRTILDLPCGHGRVMRWLKAAFPGAALTACDLDRDGVDFCAQTFGAIPVYSAEYPESIPLQGPFDLVWCGSLLTHLDQDRWASFLSFFHFVLSVGGLLVFTVHGRQSAHWLRTGHTDYLLPDVPAILRDYDESGFGYQGYRAHTHSNYGVSLSSPAWVMNQIMWQPGLRLVHYIEHGWDNHQDVVACMRDQ